MVFPQSLQTTFGKVWYRTTTSRAGRIQAIVKSHMAIDLAGNDKLVRESGVTCPPHKPRPKTAISHGFQSIERIWLALLTFFNLFLWDHEAGKSSGWGKCGGNVEAETPFVGGIPPRFKQGIWILPILRHNNNPPKWFTSWRLLKFGVPLLKAMPHTVFPLYV